MCTATSDRTYGRYVTLQFDWFILQVHSLLVILWNDPSFTIYIGGVDIPRYTMQPLCVSARERLCGALEQWNQARTDGPPQCWAQLHQTNRTDTILRPIYPSYKHHTGSIYILEREKERERDVLHWYLFFFFLLRIFRLGFIYFSKDPFLVSLSLGSYKSAVSVGSYFFYYYFLPTPFCIFPSCLYTMRDER